jgi:hypothetical protein
MCGAAPPIFGLHPPVFVSLSEKSATLQAA